jgi:hypothetical protein
MNTNPVLWLQAYVIGVLVLRRRVVGSGAAGHPVGIGECAFAGRSALIRSLRKDKVPVVPA